jgi:hypothetical protein
MQDEFIGKAQLVGQQNPLVRMVSTEAWRNAAELII